MNNTIGMAYALGEKSLKDNTLILILFYCLKKILPISNSQVLIF